MSLDLNDKQSCEDVGEKYSRQSVQRSWSNNMLGIPQRSKKASRAGASSMRGEWMGRGSAR